MNDNDIVISVIVPAYNAGHYISRCIDSILTQQACGFELIIVVDITSNDDTLKICNEYVLHNKKVNVILQPHIGPAAARAQGLRLAKGKYISFIDADDWIDNNYLRKIIEIFKYDKSVDIVITGMKRNYANGDEFLEYNTGCNQIFDIKTAWTEAWAGNMFRWEVYGKAYCVDLFKDLVIDKAITYGEDLDLNVGLFARANYVGYTSETMYHYFVHDTSYSHHVNVSMYTHALIAYKRAMQSPLNDKKTSEIIFHEYLSVQWDKLLLCAMKGFDVFHMAMDGFNRDMEEKTLLNIAYDLNNTAYPAMQLLNGHHVKIYDNLRTLFDEIKIKILRLNNSLYSYYIYGTGFYGYFVGVALKEMNISWEAYVISDGQKIPQIDLLGKKILYLSQIRYDAKKLFVLAMSTKSQKEVVPKLQEMGINYLELNFSISRLDKLATEK